MLLGIPEGFINLPKYTDILYTLSFSSLSLIHPFDHVHVTCPTVEGPVSGRGGMGSGTIAAIVVSVALALAALVVVTLLLCRRSRRSRARKEEEDATAYDARQPPLPVAQVQILQANPTLPSACHSISIMSMSCTATSQKAVEYPCLRSLNHCEYNFTTLQVVRLMKLCPERILEQICRLKNLENCILTSDNLNCEKNAGQFCVQHNIK